MATTIDISVETMEELDILKNKDHVPSYDKVIQHLIEEHEQKTSLFGVAKGLTWKKEEDRMRFDEL